VRIRGDADTSRLRLRAIFDDDGQMLFETGLSTLFVQLGQSPALPLTCARIEGVRFRFRGRTLTFRDKRNEVFEAAGIDRIRIHVMRSGRTKIRVDARRAIFGLPAPGEFRVVLAVDRVLTAGQPPVCLRSVDELVSARRGLKLP
jgi:hypothetical protein